jgi:hypothetical protein
MARAPALAIVLPALLLALAAHKGRREHDGRVLRSARDDGMGVTYFVHRVPHFFLKAFSVLAVKASTFVGAEPPRLETNAITRNGKRKRLK